MALVDHGMGALAGMPVLPLVRLGSPYLGGEGLGDRVLDHSGGVRWDALPAAAGPFYVQLVQFTVPEEHLRKFYLPVAGAGGLQGIGVRTLPVVEVPYEVDFGCIGSKFTEYPTAILCFVQAKVNVIVYGVFEESVPRNMPPCGKNSLVPRLNGILERLQPRVCLVNLFHIDHKNTAFLLKKQITSIMPFTHSPPHIHREV